MSFTRRENVERIISYSIAFKTAASRLNSSAETVSSQASNSASVMDTDMDDAGINKHRRGFRRR